MKTHNGAIQKEHSLSHALEFFSKAGSAFTKKKSFYGNEETALSLFQKSWITDNLLSMKLLLWLRDCRGGAGNRSGFRECLTWLATNDPQWVRANMQQIPEVGRWDDLVCLYDTPCERGALNLWANAIVAQHGLACKWADRQDARLAEYLGLPAKAFRKLVVKGSKVVETKMCAKEWGAIEYPHVPSVAMSRYTNAFKKHDEDRFSAFKGAVKKGEAKINASALFPHDVLRTAREGDKETAQLQWDALPNYLGESKERILCLCDASGSMDAEVSGSVKAMDVSVGLSLYCSDRLDKTNPFYRKFLEFESETHFIDWKGKSITQGRALLKGHCGSTNIQAALDHILTYAREYNVPKDQMPTTLLILSDMQFDTGTRAPWGRAVDNESPVDSAMQRWNHYGFERPRIVYWNLSSYSGSPATAKTPDTALVSGFSPSTLKAILGGQDFSPVAIMNRALTKYNPTVPE